VESARITLRWGDASDVEFVDDLGKRVVMDSVASFRRPIEAMVHVSFERLLAYVRGQSHRIIIAQADDERAGFLLLLDTMQEEVTLMPQAFIAFMAVEPGMRRRGIARAMLAEAERYARERKLPTLSMMVTEENVAARTLYERSGFFIERRMLTKVL